MGRPRTSGVNVVTKRKPDGTSVSYFYDRESGNFLGHDREVAERAIRQERAILPRTVDPADRSLSAAITLYRSSPSYDGLKPRTRETYDNDLNWLRQHYGDLPVRSFQPGAIEALKLLLKDQPYKFNNTLAVLRLALGMAVRLGWVPTNMASQVSRIEVLPREQIWTHEDEARFMPGARWELQLAMMLLLYTIQRPSDVLAMTLGNVRERDGRLWIGLRQQKTNELMDVPVHAALEPLLRARLARTVEAKDGKLVTVSALLVPSPRGLLWARRNFSRSWDAQQRRASLRLARELFAAGMTKAQVRAELEKRHRQRRDMRRTGIVRLAEAGATTPQIAAISGHKIDRCQRIIETYLPRRSEVALGGIEAWERGAGAPRIVCLPVRKKR